MLMKEASCDDCPVAIQIDDVEDRRYLQHEGHCLHRRENGESHPQGLPRHEDYIVRAPTCPREIKQRVSLLLELRMRSMVLAMTIACEKSSGGQHMVAKYSARQGSCGSYNDDLSTTR